MMHARILDIATPSVLLYFLFRNRNAAKGVVTAILLRIISIFFITTPKENVAPSLSAGA